MKIHLKYILLLISILYTLSSFAKLPTGQWQTHMSYVDGQRLAISDNKVYVVASGSLFSYGLNDNALETYTTITGLSDVYINDIAFCNSTQTLVICYSNGNIDLMDKDGIINIPDLYLKPIYGDKTINKVDIFDGIAYISTAFGILKLDIDKAEISETYKLSNNDPNSTNGVAILNNEIYAATENGLYKADLDNPNLQNFASWSFVSAIGNSNLPVVGITVFNTHVITAQDHGAGFYIKAFSTNWQTINSVGAFQSFGVRNNYLMIANTTNIRVHDSNLNATSIIGSYLFSELEFPDQNDIWIKSIIPIDATTFYAADIYQGLILYSANTVSQSLYPLGPATNTIWDINIEQGILRTVHGAVKTDYYFTRTPGAISTLTNNNWSYINTKKGVPSHPNGSDLLSIATDPTDTRRYYVTAYHKGVLEFYEDEYITRYDASNSTLKPVPTDLGALRTLSVNFDEDNNLWVTNNYVDEMLHLMTPEKEWTSFSPSNIEESGKSAVGDITFIDDGLKWLITPYWGKGIVVFDDNNTIDDASDDQTKYFSIYASNSDGTSEFVSDQVYVIEKDNDDVLWVGSDNGVALYYNPTSVFESNSNPVASRINIPRNDGTGLGDYLLDGTRVNSIAVDGGNRKWLATASTGVMLVSSDGQDILHHFTKENSPLLSNNVRQVEINQESGEVYFATEAGLISFQADATTGEGDFSNLQVYPNPVREDFFGDITITGLVDETTVKITDVSGNLVNETESNGGTAVWNGKNFYGERVGTGVYLIFCSDQEGERSGMTKVLVIN